VVWQASWRSGVVEWVGNEIAMEKGNGKAGMRTDEESEEIEDPRSVSP